MDERKAKAAFYAQRSGAAMRGIAWELTYQQWRDWWGADIEKRGVRPCDLQMQRFADSGPYALGNIRKGTPKDNGRTRSAVRQNRQSELAAAQWRALEPERLMSPPDLVSEDEQELSALGYASVNSRYEWA